MAARGFTLTKILQSGSTARRAGRIAAIAALALAGFLAGCDDAAKAPQAAIETLVAQAELAGEAGDVDGLTELLASDYSDIDGRDRRAMSFLFRRLFARFPDRMVVVRDLEIEVISEQLANASMQLVAAGREAASTSPLDIDGDRLYLQLALRVEDGGWRVVRAQWRSEPWN
jgi:hypothetical protein